MSPRSIGDLPHSRTRCIAFSVWRVKVMIASALLAAILYGVGAALEQRQAATTPSDAAGRPRLLVLLIRRPLWLLGLGAQFGGFVAHAVALRFGPLAIVQMLVATELIVSIVLVSVWSGRRLNRSSWAAALLVVAGTAAFMTLSAPTGAGDADGHGMPHRALFAVAVLGITAAGMTAVGLGAAGRRRGVLLAVAAGLADAASAVVTMSFSQLASHGLLAVVTSWPVYAVVTCGIANVLLTQTAYQTDMPMITLPVISAITPMASVVIGAGLLGEAHHVSAAAGGAAAGAALATGVALAVLARSVPSARVGQLTPVRSLRDDLASGRWPERNCDLVARRS